MRILPGMVVVSEGDWTSIVSKGIAHFTHSLATHSFVITNSRTAVEATWPRVQSFNYVTRLAELESHDRAYAILDLPGIGPQHRWQVSAKAVSYVGRMYDVGQLAVWASTYTASWLWWKLTSAVKPAGQFVRDGEGTMVCSRLVTASYHSGIGVSLFPEDVLASKYPLGFPRIENLRQGYATPSDFLRSKLEVVQFHASSRAHTVADLI